jgi:hypothetical protein
MLNVTDLQEAQRHSIAMMGGKVEFDPSDREHRIAYLLLKRKGRQHPYLRFKLVPPHSSILSMMESQLAAYACQDVGDEIR